MVPGRTYEGYVARSDGAHHWTQSAIFDGDPNTPETFNTSIPVAGVDWGEIEPRVKRTPQQRVDSLQQKIADDIMRLGYIPDSVLQEVQAEQFLRNGKIPSMEDLRALAAMFLRRADQNWDESQSRTVTRKDPTITDSGPTQAPVIRESVPVNKGE
jgi:hypothetical protein